MTSERTRNSGVGEPLASIIVATFGDFEYWDRLAQRAVRSAEGQDSPVEILRVHGETLAQARNAGARDASTPWLCFLDADDEIPRDYISASLEGRGDVRVPRVRQVRGQHVGPVMRLAPKPLGEGNFIVCGALCRRDVFLRVGGFHEWPMYEDWDLWLRMERIGRALVVECPEAVYHIHVRDRSRNQQTQEVMERVTREIRTANGVGV